ncbi:MAG TPA: DNA polymerase III subunit delta [Solimonas sp.]|nr:DNA polymerase III subunit delta [Solimonas sp.]
MRLNLNQLTPHLAQSLAPLYVVAGEEPLLAQEALDAIRAAARRAGFAEREVLDVDRYFNWQQLADACASMSLFATRRIVEVNLPSGAPGTEGSKLLQQLIPQLSTDTLLILQCGAIDWRSRQGGWYQALEKAGATLYFESMKPAEFPGWLAVRAKAAGLQIDAEALQLLAERTEGNLLAAAQDIEKLRLLFPSQKVGVEDLSQAVADSARFEAFDLNHRALSGDGAGAVRSLERLREEGVAVLELLGALVWSLRQLSKAALAYGRNRDANAACYDAGIQKNRMEPYIKALPRTRPAEVMDWLRLCARIDQQVKTGQEAAAWEDLLTLVLAVSGTRKMTAV